MGRRRPGAGVPASSLVGPPGPANKAAHKTRKGREEVARRNEFSTAASARWNFGNFGPIRLTQRERVDTRPGLMTTRTNLALGPRISARSLADVPSELGHRSKTTKTGAAVQGWKERS
ncbi:hypothetical protein KM043_008735 [Ampulex compressa]|nr:hypothetical protein KM043_008735 [Ampulex compressa]